MARRLIWVGSCKKDFLAFPEGVRREISFALHLAQKGEKAENVKPFKAFSGASVLEIVERGSSGTYRFVYAVRFQTGIYALHAFQKKSPSGVGIPRQHFEMIERRLKEATDIDARENRGSSE